MSPYARIERFFTGWRFPVVALSVLGLFTAAVGALIAWPPAPDGIGAMADQFRVWCLDALPGDAHASVWAVGATLSELLLLMAIIAWFWRAPLREGLKAERLGVAVHFGFGGLVVAGLLAWLSTFDRPVPVEPSVFPAAELRITRPAPDFTLTDQNGEKVTRSALEGRVVMVTGVYASCGLACPRILAQARRAVSALDPKEREEVTVLGLTLDPEHDDVARLSQMAEAQKVAAPLYRLLSGKPDEVNRALDAFDVSRRRNPETGVIDHANVFVLIDRQGRVAYRFGLSEQQERWLTEGLRVLVKEPRPRTAMQE